MDEELKELTRKYWVERWTVEKYIEELLPKEIDYIVRENKANIKPTDVLVQLVGLTWDPLLISLCLYTPRKLVLVLSKWYDKQEGEGRGDRYVGLLEKLRDKNLIDFLPTALPQPWDTVNDTPQDVFKFLKRHILPLINQEERVVIDITGAKKSMVSGAYLFSAYTNARVSYTDFDKFDEEYGRPYGYTCRVGELENPLELFKIGEWEQVRQLYKRYAFWSAHALVSQIKNSIKGFFEDEDLKATELLINWLEFYGLWDDGDFNGALEKFKEICRENQRVSCPTAVEKLGKIWPRKRAKGGVTNIYALKTGINSLESKDNLQNSFHLSDEMLVYAHDEVAKIRRLIEYGEDYRSAFLRAAGLNEFLIKTRIIRLWMNNEFVFFEKGESKPFARRDYKRLKYRDKQGNIKSLANFFDEQLIKFPQTITMANSLMLLKKKDGKWVRGSIEIWRPEKEESGKRVKAEGHISRGSSPLVEFWKNVTSARINLPTDIFELRNVAIHFCLSLPKELAEVALSMAEENLKDFEENWIGRSLKDGIFEAISWKELCKVCGINFLPTVVNSN